MNEVEQILADACTSGIKGQGAIRLWQLIAQMMMDRPQPEPPATRYNCVDGSCVAAEGGTYASLVECEADCAAPPDDPFVTDWLARIATAGGAEPSQNTITAMNVFCASIRAVSFESRLINVNCFVPDSLTAALVPIIKENGYDIYEDVPDTGSAVSGITAIGLEGEGVFGNTAYIDTGENLSASSICSLESIGATLLITAKGSNITAPISSRELLGNVFDLYPDFVGDDYSDVYDSGLERVNSATVASVGFISHGRNSTDGHAIYSGIDAASIALTVQDASASSLGIPNAIVSVFNVAGGGGNVSGDTLAFFAVHDGFDAGELQYLGSLVETLRNSL